MTSVLSKSVASAVMFDSRFDATFAAADQLPSHGLRCKASGPLRTLSMVISGPPRHVQMGKMAMMGMRAAEQVLAQVHGKFVVALSGALAAAAVVLVLVAAVL